MDITQLVDLIQGMDFSEENDEPPGYRESIPGPLHLNQGEKCQPDLVLSPWTLITHYPYSWVGKGNAERVRSDIRNTECVNSVLTMYQVQSRLAGEAIFGNRIWDL